MNTRTIAVRAASFLLSAGLLVAAATDAQAALTSSEKGQIRDFVAGGKPENAEKVRSLVARTDLTPEESSAALTESIAPVAWNEQRGAFLKELVFGGASAASRPVLTVASAKAVIARADALYARAGDKLGGDPRALEELLAIYGWLDAAIANAGTPTATAHDAKSGITSATYDECSKVLREHLEKNARWLKGAAAVPEPVARVRAQAQVALVDLMPDGLTRRVEAADRLGLTGARRSMLTDWGVLFTDAGKLDDAKTDRLQKLLVHLPGARTDLALVYVGGDRGARLHARGQVAYVAAGGEKFPFGDDVPAGYDPATSAIAHDLAVVAAKRVLDAKPDLRAQCERDAAAASGDAARLLGHPRAPSVEHVIGAALHGLLVDGPRAVDLAFTRLSGGQPETAALLSDALGVLAEDARTATPPKTEVGKGGAWLPVTALKLAPNGVATGFTFDAHAYVIERTAPSYPVIGGKRDAATVKGATPPPAPAVGAAKKAPATK